MFFRVELSSHFESLLKRASILLMIFGLDLFEVFVVSFDLGLEIFSVIVSDYL